MVREHIYLVTADPDHESEIPRMTMGWGAFDRHPQIMNDSLPVLKRKVYDSRILPALTYGAEACRLPKRVELKLMTTQRTMERIIGVTFRDRKRVKWVMEQKRVNDTLVDILMTS